MEHARGDEEVKWGKVARMYVSHEAESSKDGTSMPTDDALRLMAATLVYWLNRWTLKQRRALQCVLRYTLPAYRYLHYRGRWGDEPERVSSSQVGVCTVAHWLVC